jgi:hypothetical protein
MLRILPLIHVLSIYFLLIIIYDYGSIYQLFALVGIILIVVLIEWYVKKKLIENKMK